MCVIYIFYCLKIFIDMNFVSDLPMADVASMILLFMFYMFKSPEDDQVDG